MKKLAIIMFSLFIMISYVMAQKIKSDEFDPFDKVRRVQTSFVQICDNTSGQKIMMDQSNKAFIAIEDIGGIEYIRLKWTSDAHCIISKGEIVDFLDADGNIYQMENCRDEIAEKGEGVPGLSGAAYLGVNLRLKGEPGILEGKNWKMIRIRWRDTYSDLKVSKDASKKISKLYQVYRKAMKKE